MISGTRVSLRVIVSVSVLITAVAAQTHPQLSTSELGNVLHCLDTKLNRMGYAPPRFDGSSFRVRYLYGRSQKVQNDKNELQLIVYGSGEKRAKLYRVYFDRSPRPSIDIGEMGTLKRVGDRMEPDEIWGGVGSYYEVNRVLRVISAKPPIMVPANFVVAGTQTCTFQR